MQAWEWALELRTETVDWWLSDVGRYYGTQWSSLRSPNSPTAANNIWEVEVRKLANAAPFYVTQEMCELLHHAQKTFPPTKLRPVDLPVPTGFVFMAEPLWVVDIHGEVLPWQAFTWGLGHGEDPSESTGIHLTIYAHREADPQRHDGDMGVMFPTLAITHETAWAFDHDYAGRTGWGPGMKHNEGIEISEEALESGIEMLRTIHTFFILSWQKIATPTPMMATRGVRKRAQRSLPKKEIPEVRVVQLRRSKERTSTEEGSGREYSHRWMVDSFWRRQWYPSEGRHKPKWIAPHIRGPKDKPLVLKDKAYVWRR
jgi:hypothetical protein